ncbi:hypothetical protein D3797_000210 [Bacillus subtilis]|nr:hypothetical protein D3797_000210 [Bacillus subtilis]
MSKDRSKKQINYILTSDIILTFFITSIWTGLPLYFFNKTGSYMLAGSMYLIGAISTIASNFMSNYFVSLDPNRFLNFMLVLLSILNAILWYSLEQNFYGGIFVVMLILQYITSSLSFILQVTYNTNLDKENPQQTISKRMGWIMAAKTIGFSAGPILFTWFGLYVITVFMLCPLILLLYKVWQNFVIWEDTKEKNKVTYGFLKTIPISVYLFVLIDGMSIPVLLNYSVIFMKDVLLTTEYEISLSRLLSGGSIILSSLFLRKMKLQQIKKLYPILLILILINMLAMIGVSNTWIFLLSFSLLNFLNPFFVNTYKGTILAHIGNERRGSMMVAMNVLYQLGTVICLLFSLGLLHIYGNKGLYYIFITITISFLLRHLCIIKTKEDFIHENKNKYRTS